MTLVVLLIPSFRRRYFFSRKESGKKEGKIKKRLEFFDFLRGIAILAVILIHVSYFYQTFGSEFGSSFFVIFLDNLGRFAIPVFFICSGILLNPFEKNYKRFYFRKFVRIFVPYIIINLIILYFIRGSVLDLLYNLVSGDALLPFYFIVILAQFYLLYPFIIKFRDSKRFLVFSFILSFVSFLVPLTWIWGGVDMFFKFFFFFVFGIYYRDYYLNYKKDEKQFKFWIFVLLAYIVYNIIFIDDYFNVRLFYGLAIFNLLFYYKNDLMKSRIKNVVVNFGRSSLWIFLIHFLFVGMFYIIFLVIDWNLYLEYILIFLLSLVFSYVFGSLLNLIYGKLILERVKIFGNIYK